MVREFEAIFGKGKSDNDISVSTESISPIEQRSGSLDNIFIENLVVKYIQGVTARNLKSAKARMNAVKQNQEVDHRQLRIPETEFQNSLIRSIYHREISFDKIEHAIKIALAKHQKDSPVEAQEEVFKILRGVLSCKEAITSIENEMERKYPLEIKWVATNNTFDARHKVDIISAVEDEKDTIKVLNLVQVKSNNNMDKELVDDIYTTHQKYLNSLPQFIGILNAKEASMSAEKEILDFENDPGKLEQITLFCLVLDDYFSNTNIHGQINAKTFYEQYKKEGGTLNPFICMGILKNQKILDEYRSNGFLTGDKEKESLLLRTVNNIPYTEIESLVFHKKNHVKSILNSAVINSVVMVGNKIIFEQKLIKPFVEEKEELN